MIDEEEHFFKDYHFILAHLDYLMACDRFGNDRRSMTVSVTVLGLALCIVFFAYLAFSDESNNSNVSTVRFAAIVFRHGERTPSGLYPKDPHQNFSWPGGLGALSPRGALQLYTLGTMLRNNYIRLLPSDGRYTTNNARISSSAAERCLMSAQSFLAGFLPPIKTQNNLPIDWQPVAVNSIPRDRDNLISQKAFCPKYDAILKKMYADPPEELREYYKANAELFAYISEHTGANISSIEQSEQLCNILSIEKLNGLTLPKWTESVFPEKLCATAERNLALLTETPYMKQIKGGSLVTDIHHHMLQKKAGELKPDRNLLIYSGHDVTLVNVMRALDIISQTARKPDFAATLTFELHENSSLDDDLEVKIFYYINSYDKIPIPIAIPNCEKPCPLAKFGESIQSIIVHDYEKSCRLDE